MFKNVVKVSAALGALFGVFLLVLAITGHSKTPATAEQVRGILVSQDFEPADTTQPYREKWGKNGHSLIQAVSAEVEDIRFDFYLFDSDKSAEYIRKLYQSYIRDNRYDLPNAEIKEGAANYVIYTIKAGGMYTVNIRVGNTLVYAESDEENASKINGIVLAMEYF